MKTLYWLNNNNILIRVEGHYELFEKRFIKKYSKENYYDMLSKQGYLRLVEIDKEMILCFNTYNRLTDKKINFLKNYCIENGLKMFLEIDPKLQKSGYTLREFSF